MPETSYRTLQTVILAAGLGSRLQVDGRLLPKPLTPVAGLPLVEHALRHAEASGVEEAVIVLGSEAERIAAYLHGRRGGLRIRTVFNPHFRQPNGVSLLAAEPLVSGRFFLQMADHLFASPVLPILDQSLADGGDLPRLLVDAGAEGIDLDDATKVRIEGGRIRAIGKSLSHWDAVDTGCFRLDARVFDALRQAGREGPPSVSAGMTWLAERGMLVPAPLTNVAWADVDTPVDRDRAERLQCVGLSEVR
jgi:1L-myo-inositol 1-phosphate cytidylyltransferase